MRTLEDRISEELARELGVSQDVVRRVIRGLQNVSTRDRMRLMRMSTSFGHLFWDARLTTAQILSDRAETRNGPQPEPGAEGSLEETAQA